MEALGSRQSRGRLCRRSAVAWRGDDQDREVARAPGKRLPTMASSRRIMGNCCTGEQCTMKRRYTTLLPILFFFYVPTAPVLAQTAIGGGACTSSTLNGTYQFLLNGRPVTGAGTVSEM